MLKALVQIEGHQTHWQGAISSAIWRCHRLLTYGSKVFSSVFVAIRYHRLTFCSLFPFWGFLLSGSPPSHQACVFQIVFKVAEFTDAAPPSSCSIPNWILQSFFFLLGISTWCYFFLLNSSKFSRVSWFHSQTFCFQETEPWSEVQWDQVPSPTPPNKAPGSVKREILCRWGHTVIVHSNSTCSSVRPSRCINAGESSKTGPPKSSRGWKTDIRTQGIKDTISSKRRLNREFTTVGGVLTIWQQGNFAVLLLKVQLSPAAGN